MKRSTLLLRFARFSAAISAAQQESKYVLEDVFWVPESNTRARHSTLQAPLQPRVEGPRDQKFKLVKSQLDL